MPIYRLGAAAPELPASAFVAPAKASRPLSGQDVASPEESAASDAAHGRRCRSDLTVVA
jgi:hypothetical protein